MQREEVLNKLKEQGGIDNVNERISDLNKQISDLTHHKKFLEGLLHKEWVTSALGSIYNNENIRPCVKHHIRQIGKIDESITHRIRMLIAVELLIHNNVSLEDFKEVFRQDEKHYNESVVIGQYNQCKESKYKHTCVLLKHEGICNLNPKLEMKDCAFIENNVRKGISKESILKEIGMLESDTKERMKKHLDKK
jgi:transposase-like protein